MDATLKLIWIWIIAIIAFSFVISYIEDADYAAEFCGTYHAPIGATEKQYAHDSIEYLNGQWYCADYNWVDGKVANKIILEKVVFE